MTTLAPARYTGYRFPAEIISHAVWPYFRFPLGLRMMEELLAATLLHGSAGWTQ
jgi:putative transposase